MKPEPLNNPELIRKAAIAQAVERTSDVYNRNEKWCFQHMWRTGRLVEWKYSSKCEAEYRLAIVCLGIAADIMLLDIREAMGRLSILAYEAGNYDTPRIGPWVKWLPRMAEVPQLPTSNRYYDLRLW